MPLTLKYLRYRVSDSLPLLVPVATSLALLYVIVSVITWGGPQSLYAVVSSGEVAFAVGLSLATSVPAAATAVLAGIPVAYVLSRHDFRGKSVVEALLMLPFAMPPIALGASLLIFFTNTWLGTLLNNVIGIVFEVPGLIVAQFTVIFPMVVKVLKSSFDMIDVKYEAVARTLGYGRLLTLLKVLLPMSKAGLASAFILGFSRALGEFGASVTLAGATRFKTETLPIAIYLTLSSGDVKVTVALIIVIILIAFTTLLAMHAVSSRGLRGNGGAL